MIETPRKPHRIQIEIRRDAAAATKVLDCRLTMALAFTMDDASFPGVNNAVDMIAVAARKGLLQALDDIKREDIREDLKNAFYEARELPPVPAGVSS